MQFAGQMHEYYSGKKYAWNLDKAVIKCIVFFKLQQYKRTTLTNLKNTQSVLRQF